MAATMRMLVVADAQDGASWQIELAWWRASGAMVSWTVETRWCGGWLEGDSGSGTQQGRKETVAAMEIMYGGPTTAKGEQSGKGTGCRKLFRNE
ncbi:hypothetical protein SESBI_38835 [Sesbania bispinosa]|nr:hypothetical protein SESBI_38835 [Sesbania bispinosa]